MRIRSFVPLALGLWVLAALGDAAMAGAVQGPKRGTERVQPQSKVIHTIQFRGGETAEFAIVGDGDTDVDIVVFDANGRRITQDIGLSDLGIVRWTPPTTQQYRIEVVNLGNVWNSVTFGHN